LPPSWDRTKCSILTLLKACFKFTYNIPQPNPNPVCNSNSNIILEYRQRPIHSQHGGKRLTVKKINPKNLSLWSGFEASLIQVEFTTIICATPNPVMTLSHICWLLLCADAGRAQPRTHERQECVDDLKRLPQSPPGDRDLGLRARR